jgi:hypothetical protein
MALKFSADFEAFLRLCFLLSCDAESSRDTADLIGCGVVMCTLSIDFFIIPLLEEQDALILASEIFDTCACNGMATGAESQEIGNFVANGWDLGIRNIAAIRAVPRFVKTRIARFVFSVC